MSHIMGSAHVSVPGGMGSANIGMMGPAHPSQPPPPFHGIHVQLGALPVGGGPPLSVGPDRVSPHGRQAV
jgi:hypothetical protein